MFAGQSDGRMAEEMRVAGAQLSQVAGMESQPEGQSLPDSRLKTKPAIPFLGDEGDVSTVSTSTTANGSLGASPPIPAAPLNPYPSMTRYVKKDADDNGDKPVT